MMYCMLVTMVLVMVDSVAGFVGAWRRDGPKHSLNGIVPSKTTVVAFLSNFDLETVPLSSEKESPPLTSPSATAAKSTTQSRVSVLLCPAQFCVPADYEEFFQQLKDLAATDKSLAEIGTCRVAPLPRTEWIKVAKQVPTKEFLQANLDVATTLDWYFDAMECALNEIFVQEGTDTNICMIGHSIGGWVARAYLGGMSRSSTSIHRLALDQCTSLITLGTPHISPSDALVDQTRGLLRHIEETPSCQAQALADRGIDITCVASASLRGNFLSLNVEELVAASSYLPLLGRMNENVKGDGIVPLELAFLEHPARRVIIEACPATGENVRHSHVLPTPWSLLDGYAPSIRLPKGLPSYVSENVLPLWAKYIR